ncbi:hypothetical protein KC909_00040 [Candidatus Dojkabacteria bacterium]|uniref:Uncharacterized protein n=1 Tax=Candidatus Dojkabacteria bacterium TaxID=2099670 RepID=A0A955L4Z9_9BACT|nr:hypothetical protein [Candidatus Dojkabacteria bacterium]
MSEFDFGSEQIDIREFPVFHGEPRDVDFPGLENAQGADGIRFRIIPVFDKPKEDPTRKRIGTEWVTWGSEGESFPFKLSIRYVQSVDLAVLDDAADEVDEFGNDVLSYQQVQRVNEGLVENPIKQFGFLIQVEDLQGTKKEKEQVYLGRPTGKETRVVSAMQLFPPKLRATEGTVPDHIAGYVVHMEQNRPGRTDYFAAQDRVAPIIYGLTNAILAHEQTIGAHPNEHGGIFSFLSLCANTESAIDAFNSYSTIQDGREAMLSFLFYTMHATGEAVTEYINQKYPDNPLQDYDHDLIRFIVSEVALEMLATTMWLDDWKDQFHQASIIQEAYNDQRDYAAHAMNNSFGLANTMGEFLRGMDRRTEYQMDTTMHDQLEALFYDYCQRVGIDYMALGEVFNPLDFDPSEIPNRGRHMTFSSRSPLVYFGMFADMMNGVIAIEQADRPIFADDLEQLAILDLEAQERGAIAEPTVGEAPPQALLNIAQEAFGHTVDKVQFIANIYNMLSRKAVRERRFERDTKIADEPVYYGFPRQIIAWLMDNHSVDLTYNSGDYNYLGNSRYRKVMSSPAPEPERVTQDAIVRAFNWQLHQAREGLLIDLTGYTVDEYDQIQVVNNLTDRTQLLRRLLVDEVFTTESLGEILLDGYIDPQAVLNVLPPEDVLAIVEVIRANIVQSEQPVPYENIAHLVATGMIDFNELVTWVAARSDYDPIIQALIDDQLS